MTRSQRYYLRHKARVRAANLAWASRNPEAVRAINSRYERQTLRRVKKSAYKEKNLYRWQPGGRYYKPIPHALREAIRLNNELKGAL